MSFYFSRFYSCPNSFYAILSHQCCLSAIERPTPVHYDGAGEQSIQVVTPLVAVLAVVSTFVMALLAVAFIADAGILCSLFAVV